MPPPTRSGPGESPPRRPPQASPRRSPSSSPDRGQGVDANSTPVRLLGQLRVPVGAVWVPLAKHRRAASQGGDEFWAVDGSPSLAAQVAWRSGSPTEPTADRQRERE